MVPRSSPCPFSTSISICTGSLWSIKPPSLVFLYNPRSACLPSRKFSKLREIEYLAWMKIEIGNLVGDSNRNLCLAEVNVVICYDINFIMFLMRGECFRPRR